MKTHQQIRAISLLFILIASHSMAQSTLNWLAHYNGGSNQSDKALAIAIDNNCNTYVTGQSDSIGQGTDIITIKYDASGNILWLRRWDGPNHLDDIPSALKVDNAGNAFVCGKSTGLTTGSDWITLKYDNNGSLQWAKRFNNNGTNGNLDDGASDLALNNSTGNVYVTGYGTNLLNSTSGVDAMTRRYSSAGTLLDSVISNSFSSNEVGYRIKLDNSGNVCVLTYDDNYYNNVYKYLPTLISGSFNTSWPVQTSTNTPPAGINVDNSANNYIVGTYVGVPFYPNIYVEKNDINNNWVYSPIIVRFPSGTIHADIANSFTLDNAGNIYIVGSSSVNNGDKDFLVIKCNNLGDTVWTRTYAGPASLDDEALAVALTGSTSSPDVVVCGYTTNVSGNKDITFIKYSNTGNLISAWTQNYDSNDDDSPTGMVKDQYDNIAITGYSGLVGVEDFSTLKYAFNSLSPLLTNHSGDSLSVTSASSYQWYRNNVLLAGATGQGINMIPYGNGLYHCVVIQYCNTYYSDTMNMTTVNVGNLVTESSYFSIYPNPVNDKLNIEFPSENLQSVSIIIYNMLGEKMMEQTFPIGNKQITLDVSKLTSGVYSCKIFSGKAVAIKKFLME